MRCEQFGIDYALSRLSPMSMDPISIKKRQTTLKDVAAAVGVSVATVSYVVNGKHVDRVSPKTRHRVLKAVEALNYLPNATARSLVTNRSQTLGIYLPSSLEALFRDVGCESLIAGILQKATLDDYRVLLACEGSNLKYSGVDAWICLRAKQPVAELERLSTPTLYLAPDFIDNEVHSFYAADMDAGKLLGCTLAPQCESILFFDAMHKNGKPTYLSELRYQGLIQGLGGEQRVKRCSWGTLSNSEKSRQETMFNETLLSDPSTVWIVADEKTAWILAQKINSLRQPQVQRMAAFVSSLETAQPLPLVMQVNLKYSEVAYRATHTLLHELDARQSPSRLKLKAPPQPELIL